jgi:inner membrane protein involved in colicin E2 resistance
MTFILAKSACRILNRRFLKTASQMWHNNALLLAVLTSAGVMFPALNKYDIFVMTFL